MKALILLVSVFAVSTVGLANPKAETLKKEKVKKNLNLKTEANFTRGAQVDGQYGKMAEADVSVEAEKKRIDIVEPRKNWNFKNKISKGWH